MLFVCFSFLFSDEDEEEEGKKRRTGLNTTGQHHEESPLFETKRMLVVFGKNATWNWN
jgi:hypothetical protein